ncbi:MAG: FecR domain-containing protein [Gammaproteobacteria bacterium]
MDSEVPKSEPIEEAAVRWFARQQSGTWTAADQAEFDAWREAATAHRVQYIRVSAAWDNAARMKALGAGVPAGEVPPRGSWGDARFLRAAPAEVQTLDAQASTIRGERVDSPDLNEETLAATQPGEVTRRRVRRNARFFAAAATVLAFAVGIYLVESGSFNGTHYSTPVGGIDNVPLVDGSRITLNTDTSIRVSLSANERRIQLDKGEAFFEVAKDKTRPFVVYAGNKRVVAVGTKFSVRRDRDDIRVVVTEGRVNLAVAPGHSLRGGLKTQAASGSGSAVEPPAETADLTSTFLDAGAIAQTAKTEVLVRPDAAAETEKLLSWRRGYVNFENVPLADAVAEFNRYNTRKIFIRDPAIAAIHVGGNFRSNNSEAFLSLLQSGFPIDIEENDDAIVLKSR